MKPAVRAAAVDALRCEADDMMSGAHIYSTEEDEGVDDNVVSFAMSAVWRALGFMNPLEIEILEAAALLEDGWNPGEPVENRDAP